MLKLLSWNINGIGKEEKRKWVRDAVRARRISFLCLQETKAALNHNWQVKALWSGNSQDFAAQEAVGNSSGILTVWDPVHFSASSVTKQAGFVAVKGIWKENRLPLGVINVYTPQSVSRRRALWEAIKASINEDSCTTWIVCGDFNEVRSPEERKGSVFDPYGASFF